MFAYFTSFRIRRNAVSKLTCFLILLNGLEAHAQHSFLSLPKPDFSDGLWHRVPDSYGAKTWFFLANPEPQKNGLLRIWVRLHYPVPDSGYDKPVSNIDELVDYDFPNRRDSVVSRTYYYANGEQGIDNGGNRGWRYEAAGSNGALVMDYIRYCLTDSTPIGH